MRLVRSFASLVLVLAVMAPGLGALATGATRAEATCSAHVCQCLRSRHCPPKRQTASGCHGRGGTAPACAMRGTCGHDREASIPGGAPVWTAPEATEEALRLEGIPYRHDLISFLAPGFARVDPRPPRKA